MKYLNNIYFRDAQLYFQHHCSSRQCHMIFRNHNNMQICCRKPSDPVRSLSPEQRSAGVRRVTAACRWRVCGSCWRWRCLSGRDWRKSWSAARIWASARSTPSRSHTAVWPRHRCAPERALLPHHHHPHHPPGPALFKPTPRER